MSLSYDDFIKELTRLFDEIGSEGYVELLMINGEETLKEAWEEGVTPKQLFDSELEAAAMDEEN